MKITVRELLEKLTMIVILLAMVFAIAWHPRTAQAADPGELTISKTVVSPVSGDSSITFSYKVTLYSDVACTTTVDDDNTYDGVVFTDGVATVTIGGDADAVTIRNLPSDLYYSVEAEDKTNFTATAENASGSLSAGAEASFTMKRTTGSLKINLDMTSDLPSDSEREFQIRIRSNSSDMNCTLDGVVFTDGIGEITLKQGQSKTITGLPAGMQFMIERTAITGITGNGYGSVYISNSTQIINLTETRNTGDLTISSVLVSDADYDQNQVFSYTVQLGESITKTYSGVSFVNGKATIELTGSDSKTIEGLPETVAYTVTQTDVERFKTETVSNNATYKIKSTPVNTLTFTNTRAISNLKITTEVVNPLISDDLTRKFSFVIELSGMAIDKTYETGLYEDNFVAMTSGTISFSNGKADLELSHNQGFMIKGLPIGVTYSVIEKETSGFKLIGKTDDNGTITAIPPTATFEYERETGALELDNKVISSTAADQDEDFNFEVRLYRDESHSSTADISGAFGDMTFTSGESLIVLKHNEKATATGLPTGVYYEVSQYVKDGFSSAKTGDTGLIKNEKSVASFTNTREEGNLIVSNSVGSAIPTDKNMDFEFMIKLYKDAGHNTTATDIHGTYGEINFNSGRAVFNLKDGEQRTATGLPAGISYTVEEAYADGFTTAWNGQNGRIMSGSASVVQATNTRNTGDLKVSNVINTNNPSDIDEEFTFTITFSEMLNGVFSSVEIVDGVATIQLRGGENKLISGLPVGISYQVVETEKDGFELTSKTDDSGVISGTLTQATFTNTAIPKISITVRANWDDASNQDGLRPNNITAELYAENLSLPSRTVALSAANSWTYTWIDLDESKNGVNIAYAIRAGTSPTGYTSGVAGDTASGFVVTYTHVPETTSRQVNVSWEDADNSENLRPASIHLSLFGNGTQVDSKTINVGTGNISTVFDGLQKYSAGTEIVYTLKEDAITGYDIGYTQTASGWNVLNTILPTHGTLQIAASFAADANSKTLSSSDTSGVKITVTAPSGETTYQVGRDFTNGVLVLNDLAVGTYTVTEDVNSAHVDGYTLTVTGNAATVTVEAGKTKEVTIVNTYTGAEIWEPYVFESGEKDYASTKLDLKATASGNLAMLVKKAVRNGSGKWVRYGSDGSLVKGWYTVNTPTVEEIYYFDKQTGMKVTGDVVIDGKLCHFDSSSGLYQP